MTISLRQGLTAVIAFLLSLSGFLALSTYSPSMSYFPLQNIRAESSPMPVMMKGKTVFMYLPSGPSYKIMIRASESSPTITRLSIRVEMGSSWVSWSNATLMDESTWFRNIEFHEVNEGNPLYPGETVVHYENIVGSANFIDGNVFVSGTFADGQSFNQFMMVEWS